MRRDVPRLRRHKLAAVIRRALIRGCNKEGFRICHFSIQSNHIHLVCEADHHVALARGMQGFNIRVAKGINKALARRGAVLEQRYSARHARSATQVRHTLSYVLHNARRHGARFEGADAFSSARYFDGWARPTGLPPPDPDGNKWPVAPARTELLGKRWRFIGLIDPDEMPAGGRATA